jgi:DNA-binding CsgD family transcriptional regulator
VVTDQAPAVQLTPREMDVLRLLCAGMTGYAELTAELCISPHTLHYYLAQIRWKLNVSDRAQIVAYAMVHGMLDPETLEWRGGSAA